MSAWVLFGGLVATAIVWVGLYVGAGSWLVDAPPWRTGRAILVGCLVTSGLWTCGGTVTAFVAWREGWVPPRFAFDLEVPVGTAGPVVLELCPDRGAEPTGRVPVDDVGVAIVHAADDGTRREIDVFDTEGAAFQGVRRGSGAHDGCTAIEISVGVEPWSVPWLPGEPGPYVERARRDHVPVASLSGRLMAEVVVPDGYRGDALVRFCGGTWQTQPRWELGPDGTATVAHPSPNTTDGLALDASERSGRVLAARVVATDWEASGNCALVGLRIADTDPDMTARTARPMEDRYAEVQRTGHTFAEVTAASP